MYIRTQTADCQVEDVTDDEDQHEGNHADDVEARHGAQKVKDVCNDAAGKTQRQDTRVGQYIRQVAGDVVQAHHAFDRSHQDILFMATLCQD